MSYSEYCSQRAYVLNAYVLGNIGYFTAAWSLLRLRARYGR